MTPTCNTCGTKFPGKDACKNCGADPNTPASREHRAAKVKMVPAVTVTDRRTQKAKIRSITNVQTPRKHGRNR